MANEILSKVKLREIEPEQDLNFILSTWLKSYKQSEFALHIPNQIYYPHQQKLIESIITHEHNRITILCNSEDPAQIIGYIVYSIKHPIIYYTYIKHAFRKFGFGKFLFSAVSNIHPEAESIKVTHKPKRWVKTSKKYKLVYNPYITG